jgi:hypothetical protein
MPTHTICKHPHSFQQHSFKQISNDRIHLSQFDLFKRYLFKQYSLQQIFTLFPIYGTTHTHTRKCHTIVTKNTILIHSQRKSFIHKERLDSKYQSGLGLPKISETTKLKTKQYAKLQIHNRTARVYPFFPS